MNLATRIRLATLRLRLIGTPGRWWLQRVWWKWQWRRRKLDRHMQLWLNPKSLDPEAAIASLQKWQHTLAMRYGSSDNEAHINRIFDAAWLWVSAMHELENR